MKQAKETILITGGARRIGAALARHFAGEGYDLILHYSKSKKEAERLAQSLRKSVRISLVQADFTVPEQLSHFWRDLPATTAIIHNASLFKRDTLATMRAASIRDHLAVHVEAPLLLTQGFLKQLPKTKVGSILLLGDATFGWSLAPQFFSYAVSKHALTSVLDLLAAAAAPRARVNLIGLGPTLQGAMDDAKTFRMLAGKAPLQRTATVADVCEAASYLMAAKGVTGQNLSLANGFDLRSFRRGFPAD